MAVKAGCGISQGAESSDTRCCSHGECRLSRCHQASVLGLCRVSISFLTSPLHLCRLHRLVFLELGSMFWAQSLISHVEVLESPAAPSPEDSGSSPCPALLKALVGTVPTRPELWPCECLMQFYLPESTERLQKDLEVKTVYGRPHKCKRAVKDPGSSLSLLFLLHLSVLWMHTRILCSRRLTLFCWV